MLDINNLDSSERYIQNNDGRKMKLIGASCADDSIIFGNSINNKNNISID